MGFKKAQPQQARLKVSIYGPPGSGKTFTTLLFAEGLAKARGKRVAYVDTERGTDFYAQKVEARGIHPEAFDFDALYTKSLSEVLTCVKGLNPDEHGVVVLDSISHLWTSAMEAYEGRKTKIDSIPMHAWGAIKKPYKELLNFLIGSKFDVFILGRQKNVFETDEGTDEMKKVGVAMRAEGETAYEPHICLRMEAKSNPADTKQSVVLCHVEKDRTGVLSGKTIVNPSFDTISPLLPLLGEIQAPVEDEDERIAKDSELLVKNEEKSKAKEGKSLEIFQLLQPELMAANDLSALGKTADAIKKQKRYLLDEHIGVLTEIYKSKREKLVANQAGDL